MLNCIRYYFFFHLLFVSLRDEADLLDNQTNTSAQTTVTLIARRPTFTWCFVNVSVLHRVARARIYPIRVLEFLRIARLLAKN